MPGKCRFKHCWLENSLYKMWLLPDADIFKARCKFCLKQIGLASMGESALTSHMKSKKHLECAKANMQPSLDNYVAVGEKTTRTVSSCEVSLESALGPRENLSSEPLSVSHLSAHWVRNTDTWKAEILWTLKNVMSHYSSKSCESNSEIFQTMFPDSKIARTYSCGERKTAYLINHGLKPYFLNKLLDSVKSKDMYVLLFDEAMNKKLQEKQLDLHVRYYDDHNQRVQTYYLDSAFMGHGRASDIEKTFCCLTEKLNLSHLLQISMDGPNVNLKFLNDLKTNVLEEITDKKLLDIGTCSLHKMHNVFRAGFQATEWDIEGVMMNSYGFFKDSPARRDDFVSVTGNKEFPLKFCSHRWVENERVAHRALTLLPHITKFIKLITSDKKFTTPTSKTFANLKEACCDPFTPARLSFFISVASSFTPYLLKYQTDNPMVPFMADDIEKIIKSLASRILKKDILENLNSKFKLATYEFSDSDLLELFKIDIGFSAEKLIKQALLKKEITDRQRLEFLLDCRKCLSVMLRKMLSNNPLTSTFIRSASCLNPTQMAKKTLTPQCCKQFKKILIVITDTKRFDERKCDAVIGQYSMFLNEKVPENMSKFLSFSDRDDRLDIFFSELLSRDVSYTELWYVIRCVLVLSHGQASVERGFSVNSKMTVENKKENTYIAQRIIQDSVRQAGGLMKVRITDELITYAKGARCKYEQYLNLNKEKETTELKRKAMEDVNEKRKRLMKDIEHLEGCAEAAAEDAEKTSKRECFVRFNTFRKAIQEKKQELNLMASK